MDDEDSNQDITTNQVQVDSVSSTNRFYSGRRDAMPVSSSTKFMYLLKNDDGEEKTVFVENTGTLRLSEYNFGRLFDHSNTVTLEMKLDFHYMFEYMLDVKWPNVDFEYTINVYTERKIAIYELENVDYWPCILAWCAYQCMRNGLNFFHFVRLVVDEDGDLPYDTVFA